jgi:hypothetical protein
VKVLVTGGRDYTDRQTLYRTLAAIDADHGISVIIEGCAEGADRLAAAWARDNEIGLRHFPAQWREGGVYNPLAGKQRNQRMLHEGRPDLVVAFPGGQGTAHMVDIARRAGVPIRWVVRGPFKADEYRTED